MTDIHKVSMEIDEMEYPISPFYNRSNKYTSLQIVIPKKITSFLGLDNSSILIAKVNKKENQVILKVLNTKNNASVDCCLRDLDRQKVYVKSLRGE